MKKYKDYLDKMKEFIMPYLNDAKTWIVQCLKDILEQSLDHKRILLFVSLFALLFLIAKYNLKLFAYLFIGFVVFVFIIANINSISYLIFWLKNHWKRIGMIVSDMAKFFILLCITLGLSYLAALKLVGYLPIDKQIDPQGFLEILIMILISIFIHTILSLIGNYILIKWLKERKSIIIIECILKIITTVFFATIIGLNTSISKYLIQFADLSIPTSSTNFDFEDVIRIIIYMFLSLCACHSITFEAAKKINQKNMAG